MVQGVPQGRDVRPKRGDIMIIERFYRVISESEFSFEGRIQGRGPFLAPGMAPKCFYFLLNDSIFARFCVYHASWGRNCANIEHDSGRELVTSNGGGGGGWICIDLFIR